MGDMGPHRERVANYGK